MARGGTALSALGLLLAVGCGTVLDPLTSPSSRRIDRAIAAYYGTAGEVEIGALKADVLAALLPTQEELQRSQRKYPDVIETDQGLVEIFYFRSMRIPDGSTTDDEFTPYTFLDGRLVAIGWTVLGGPKTIGARTRPQVHAVREQVTTEGGRKVYDADECIGAIGNGVCYGSILPKRVSHPTCYGDWIGGRCTGPQF